MRDIGWRAVTAIAMVCAGSTSLWAEQSVGYAALAADQVLVPQNLLNLLHTPEVQAEWALSGDQQAAFENVLREIDKGWWPSRILPLKEQRKIVAELEAKAVAELERLAGSSAVQRLRQIELQSQGVRMLVRPEVARSLGLDIKQLGRLTELFEETDRLGAELAKKDPSATEKSQRLLEAKQAEPRKALAILQPVQSDILRRMLGRPLDTTKLVRIFPFAPELIDSGSWTLADQPRLESLRGQVVLVHFYAFQCHNCVANFGHYKRWDEQLRSKGVRVIGIQTPETASERDPERVRNAASKEGFGFPVLIDLKNENWKAWGNTMWPTVYVIDKKGYIRFWWQGELNWQGATVDQQIEKIIDKLLEES